MSSNSDNSSTMTSRQRVLSALSYEQVDRTAVDLGGTLGTGAHVSVIANLSGPTGISQSEIVRLNLFTNFM